jgi:SanA protein
MMRRRPIFFLALGCGAMLAFVLLTALVFYVTTKNYIYDTANEAPSAEVALIPGAAILSNGAPSSIFIDRVDVAIDLYKAGKVLKILVSGDNSTVSHNEVNPVRLYLLGKGIPDQDIFLDHAGFDTYSSLYRARDIFGVTSILITTQSFHLPRAVFTARRLGIQAYGVRTDVGYILFRNYVREVFADEKAVFDLVFHTKPKYLGDTIPITGDGRNYP